MKNFDEILRELEYRAGQLVDLKNKRQIFILSEILEETEFRHIKNEILNIILEKDEPTPRSSKEVEKEKAEDEKYVYTSHGIYIKAGDEAKYNADNTSTEIEKFKKDDDGKFVKLNYADTNKGKLGDNPTAEPTAAVPAVPDNNAGNAGGEQEATEPVANITQGKDGEVTQERWKDEEQSVAKVKTDGKITTIDAKTDYSKKSEATEGLFAGLDKYRSITNGKKSVTVRPMIDPETDEPLDTSQPDDRKRAIEILDKRLKSMDEKAVRGIQMLKSKSIPSNQRINVMKWLGEVGELQAYSSLLKSDKVYDVYMYTDSEPKNDLVVIGKTEKREIFLKGVSVKAAESNTMGNKLGSSIKPDLENAIHNAETQSINLDGIAEKVDTSVVMNSYLELRKRLLKEASSGKVRQNKTTNATEVVDTDGNVMTIADYFRKGKITNDIIDKVFSNDNIFKGNNNPIRSLSDEKVDDLMTSQLRKYFKKQFTEMAGNDGITIADMQEKIVDQYIDIYEKAGANLTPATDMMVSYYEESGFKENKIVPKEDFENKIKEVLNVDDFNKIDKRTQFKTILGLAWTGRGAYSKADGTGHIDGQSYGRPNPKLSPEPRPMNDYIDNVLK